MIKSLNKKLIYKKILKCCKNFIKSWYFFQFTKDFYELPGII